MGFRCLRLPVAPPNSPPGPAQISSGIAFTRMFCLPCLSEVGIPLCSIICCSALSSDHVVLWCGSIYKLGGLTEYYGCQRWHRPYQPKSSTWKADKMILICRCGCSGLKSLSFLCLKLFSLSEKVKKKFKYLPEIKGHYKFREKSNRKQSSLLDLDWYNSWNTDKPILLGHIT